MKFNKNIIKSRVNHLENLGYRLELVSGMITDIKETILNESTYEGNVRLHNICESLKRGMDGVDKMYGWLHGEYIDYLSKNNI